MTTYRVVAFDQGGNRVKDEMVETLEEPAFLAHQLLHVGGVTCANVLDALTGELLLRRCDPEEDPC